MKRIFICLLSFFLITFLVACNINSGTEDVRNLTEDEISKARENYPIQDEPLSSIKAINDYRKDANLEMLDVLLIAEVTGDWIIESYSLIPEEEGLDGRTIDIVNYYLPVTITEIISSNNGFKNKGETVLLEYSPTNFTAIDMFKPGDKIAGFYIDYGDEKHGYQILNGFSYNTFYLVNDSYILSITSQANHKSLSDTIGPGTLNGLHYENFKKEMIALTNDMWN